MLLGEGELEGRQVARLVPGSAHLVSRKSFTSQMSHAFKNKNSRIYISFLLLRVDDWSKIYKLGIIITLSFCF